MDFQVTQITPSAKENFAPSRNVNWTKWVLIFSGLFVATGLAFFLLGRSSFSADRVEFKINGPEEISSGGKAVYKIKYANRNKQAIKNLKLSFFYPADAIVIKENQVSQFLTENVEIASLSPEEEGELEFSAYLTGNKGDIKKARALLAFSPEGVNSDFEKESTLATNISSLDVSLVLVAPPNAVSGQNVSYILDYRNESQDDLRDLTLKIDYPDGFTVSNVSPSASTKTDTWELKNLKAGEGQRITISGVLRGSERESKSVAVVLQRKIDGLLIDYEKASSSTVISTPPLSAGITVNGKIDYIAQLGDELDYQIKFANNSDADLLGLTLTVKLEGSMFDFSSVITNGFFDSVAKTITWNASVSPLLNRLASGQEGAVNFRVKLKSGFASGGLGVKDFVVKAGVHIETPTIPVGFDVEKLTTESSLVTKISSLPVFEQQAFYNDEVNGNSGPFPPKAGQKTFYTVSWHLSNASNDFSKTRVKAVLPIGVNWENRARVNGQQSLPVFKPGSREVIWDLGTLPFGVGGQFPKYQGWFQISFTPSSNNVGQPAKLIQDVFLEGEDSFTRQAILVKVKDITTGDLIDFPGQGSVVE